MNRKIYLFILFAVYFLAIYTLFGYYNITCVFLEITGLPCPGCGMTRAFISLTRFRIADAVKYNVVVFFMPYVFSYVFFDLKGRIHNILLLIIAVIAIINWMIKILFYF